MKNKELIELLLKCDPEKDVMIQQGGDADYLLVYGAEEMEVMDEDGEGDDPEDETGILNIVAIKFT